MRTTFGLLLAWAAQLGAQTSPLSAPLTVRGTVVEGGVNSPIANAIVILNRPGVTPPEREQTTSAADGSFQFKIQTTGSFTVSASLKGYTGIAGRFGAPSDVQGVLVEPQTKGPLDARLVLARQATITGKIVDFEKNTPIPGMNVALSAISYASGRLLRQRTMLVPTGENGQFEIVAPTTGRFVLSVPDAPSPLSEHITTEPSNEASVEYRYETPYWPGVDDIESARIFELASGSRVNAGTLALRQVPHYSARVSVRGTECKPESPLGASLSRELQDRSHQYLEQKQIVCGQDFGLRALRPGRYRLEIFSRPDAVESRKRAKLLFDVTDHNQNLEATLTLETSLTGAFSAPEGFRDFQKLGLAIFAIDAVTLEPRGPIEVDAKGAFTIPNLPPGEMYVQINRLPEGFYVRKVRFNNQDIDDNFLFPFVWNGGGSLIVEIDNQPAAVRGTVRGPDGNAANAARVVFARLPLNKIDPGTSLRAASVNEAGVFNITGLTDTEYRVFAYASDFAPLLDEPGRLERVVSTAKRISLKRGETQTLDLTLTDVSR